MPAGKTKKVGLSVRAFAKMVGVGESAVRQRIQKGRRIAEAVLFDGSLDPDRAEMLWQLDNPQHDSGTAGKSDSANRRAALEALDLNLIKAEREAVDLARARIGLAKDEKSVIDRGDARRIAVSFARILRDALLQFANREGPGIAGELGTDTRLTVAVLDAAMRKLAEEVAKQKIPFEE